MRFDILTIFPDLFKSPLEEGILCRALSAGQLEVVLHNIRDYAFDRHKMTDDRPFGGGEGMLMKAEPLSACLQDVKGKVGDKTRVILLSPQGKSFNQQKAEELALLENVVLVCGRYEGVDERFIELFVDEEISLGDYVLTGGELAAMVLLDSVTRLLPGVLGCENSAENDSFSRGLLKHPQYTRPREFMGLQVPEVLLSGNHAAIEQYRFQQAVCQTLKKRPELLQAIEFEEREIELLQKVDLWQEVMAIQGKKKNAKTSA